MSDRISNLIIAIAFCFIIAAAIFTVGHDRKTAKSDIVHNVSATIVELNGDNQRLSPDKFRTPQTCNKVLFKILNEKDMYFTFQSCNNLTARGDEFVANDEWMYNHNVGDTVLFTAIKKSRFFRIQR